MLITPVADVLEAIKVAHGDVVVMDMATYAGVGHINNRGRLISPYEVAS